MRLTASALGITAALVAGSVAAPPSGGAARSAVTYRAPVEPVLVVRPFVPPPTPLAAGHRGVDLAVPAGAVVRSAGAGVVTFAGQVAGRGVVVVQHPDGVSTEYEPLAIGVTAGTAVTGASSLGTVRGRHGTCAPGRCLHWGARRDGAYFDPMLLLAPLGPVRLLPWTDDMP